MMYNSLTILFSIIKIYIQLDLNVNDKENYILI